MPPHIGMVLYGDPSFDTRVQREARALVTAGYRVTIHCLGVAAPGALALPEQVRIRTHTPRRARALPGSANPYWDRRGGERSQRVISGARWIRDYSMGILAWGHWVRRVGRDVDAWHAHDLPGLLALGPTPGRHRPVIYDSHEIFVDSGTASRLPAIGRFALARVERTLSRRAAGVLTVNGAIALELAARYGVRPRIVMNCPPLAQPPKAGTMRQLLRLGDRPVVLCHGGLSEDRGLEQLIDAVGLLDPEIVLVILGDGPLREELAARAVARVVGDRVHLQPAVPPSEVLNWVMDADVGAVLMQPATLNDRLVSPNRLFDFISCGVPVVASDFPVLRSLVVQEGIGVVCEPRDAAEIAEAIASLLRDGDRRELMRARASDAFRRDLNWEAQSQVMLGLYAEVLGTDGAPSS